MLSREFPQQIDVAYEGVGGELREAVLDNLSPKGCLLSVGYISEYPHVKADADEDSHQPASSSSNGDLPPAHELFLAAANHQAGRADLVWRCLVGGTHSLCSDTLHACLTLSACRHSDVVTTQQMYAKFHFDMQACAIECI